MRVTHAIESVTGVRNARVSFEEKRAEVQSDSCSLTTLEQISAALHQAGYGGTAISIGDAL